MAAGDIDQHTTRAFQADFIQKRIGDGLLGGLNCTIFARGFAGAHHRLAHFVHHRADIGEIQVDDARANHQIGHAFDALIQHVIGHGEGFGECGFLIREPEQVLVRNDDQRVNDALQFFQPMLGLIHPARTFELKRFGDNANGQDSHFPGRLGNHRGRTGSGAAAHPGGDKAHMRPGQMIDDFFDGFRGGMGADFRLCARTQAFGDFYTKLDFGHGVGLRQRLSIGIRNNEFRAFKLLGDHVVDRISSGPANTKDGDTRAKFRLLFRHAQVQGHIVFRLCF